MLSPKYIASGARPLCHKIIFYILSVYLRFERQTTRRRQIKMINWESEVVMITQDVYNNGDSKLGYLSDKMHTIRLQLWICKQLDEKISIMLAQYRLRGFENRTCTRRFACKREEVMGWCRKPHNKELHNLYSSGIQENDWRWVRTGHGER